MAVPRVLVYSNQDVPLFELDPSHLHEMRTVEVINGEHSLTVTTTQSLEKTQRLLTVDETGKAREYVVTGVDEEHQGGRRLVGTYYAVWSLQYDLSGIYTTSFPGYDGEASAEAALGMLLENTSRWSVGTVTQATFGMASFYYLSGWKALSELVDTWGGEVDAAITVGSRGVTSRQVCLLAHQGSTVAVRRFDYGADLTGIRRKVADDVVTPRILPLGKSQGVNGARLGIADVNGGVPYLQDDGSAALYRVPDGSGGWEYPTQVVVNDDAEWPEQLMEWAEEVMEQYTRPKVTYEASVAQLATAGMDAHGLALGDDSQVVDRTFGDGGLRVSGRVVKLEIDELDHSNTVVTLGHLSDGMPGALGDLASRVNAVQGGLGYMSTAAYLNELLRRINSEINATGGWAYIVPGEGIITYDKEVVDPLTGMGADGSYANQVVQVKGGSMRIANTKNASFAGINDWNWRTVFTSGLVASDVLTASNVVTGVIEDAAHKLDASSGNFWNLDTGELRMASTAKVGGRTIGEVADGAAASALESAKEYTDSAKTSIEDWRTQENIFNALTNNGETQGIYLSNGKVYINGTYINTGQLNASLITSGRLLVKDGDGNVLFDANIGSSPQTVQVAGFTVGASSLYNGLPSLSRSGVAGVYVGTDGVASASSARRMVLTDGALTGYDGARRAGVLYGSSDVMDAEDSSRTVASGMAVDTPAFIIKADKVYVKKSVGSDGTVRVAQGRSAEASRYVMIPAKDYASDGFDPDEDEPLKLSMGYWFREHVGGLLFRENFQGKEMFDTFNVYVKKQVDRKLGEKVNKADGKKLTTNDFTDALKAKLQGIEAGAQKNPDLSGYATEQYVDSAVSGKADSSALEPYATREYVDQAVAALHVPTFSLSGNVLTITP